MGYPWFCVFVSLVAKKLISCCWLRIFGFPGWFSYVLSMPFKMASLVFASSQVGLALIQCVFYPKAWFHTFGVAVSLFPGAFHSFQKGLPCLCPFCALSVFLWALVSKKPLILSWLALFLSLLCSFCLLVGLGVKKTLILSWFALFLSLLCSFCLLVGLGVKKLSS